ncbi:MAG TPA: hypothetical protein VHW69_09400 [Rhizomicrobium sp.]|nr:hypothetical protein [Rhizomicrobium sp.]
MYPEETSRFACEQAFDLGLAQAVKIIWNGELAAQESQPANLRRLRCIDCDNLCS